MLKRGEETRVTDPNTGGQKGAKPERFSLLPFDALDEIVRSYNYGADKYAPHNWRRGYAWSLSFDALMRHLTAWWEGEDRDPESGHSHLAHAGWHVLALLWFQLNAKGTDDRYNAGKGAMGPQVPVPGSLRDSIYLDGTSHMENCAECQAGLGHANKVGSAYDDFMSSYDPVTRTWIVSTREESK